MHGARSTVLRAFSHFHAIYRCFPYSCTLCKPDSQLKIDPTPTLTPLPLVMGVVKLRIGYPLGRQWSTVLYVYVCHMHR